MLENIYDSPSKFRLKIFAEVERELSYEFSIFVVFQNEAGELFYAEDEGCSCPAPFENLTMDTLQPIIGADGLKAFFDALNTWRNENYDNINTDYVRRKVREYMTRG